MIDRTQLSLDAMRLAIIGLAATALLVSPARRAAAATANRDSLPTVSDRDDEQNQTQTDRETKVLALGANGTLDLKNISGNVIVAGGSGREVRVEITRRSRGRTEDDARLGLQRVTVTFDQQGDRAVVATQYPREERRNAYSVDVTFTVTAPAGTRINANSVSGDVRVEHMKADVSAHSVSGNVTVAGAGNVVEGRSISGNVSVSDVNGDSVALGTVSGDLLIDRVTARRIEAETTSGEVRATGVSSDRATLRSLSGTVVYAGAITRGGRYELQSHSGNVSFEPAGPVGYELEATTFSGTITPPRGMATSSISTSRARAFHGTVGSGGASVSITTFSGDVRVGAR
jgi:hypothetical protein